MNLKITQLDFSLTVLTKMSLPEHPESNFRGAFGNELRKLCCLTEKDICKGCRYEDQCAYRQIFEPVMDREELEKTSRRFLTKPRPYILEVKTNRQMEFLPGDEINLRFRFFGEINTYLPFIILSWQKVGQVGIGPDQGKFIISEVWNTNLMTGKAKRIYSEYLNLVYNIDLCMEMNQIDALVSEMPTDQIRIKLLTPMMLKANGRFVKRLEFELLMKNLFRRLSSLVFFYGEGELNLDFPTMLEKASEVKLVRDNTRLVSWSRYSTRQNQKIGMAGLVGEVIYEGELGPFLPYLVLGQYCYVGKNTVFGQGNYKIIPGRYKNKR
ncbi:hypothetical protein BBF96_03855 [Anoxybacter fermentans]|uniref:CRISPR-associated protein Cas6 C-terminal domain-containing protein n=1 Tax=Anoxybacter fermentans TaxID=1323375 RepID=A0A3S9SWA4_9FIRM|nr:CRISPR system precrRNA processing endoribonuclease RAMP protein Cas6 [Anoxybacter fermentans]AZR72596.1 hypothetical protein BBF96_03855 [Anoxybacter fermentans]